jgi:hypothetical protein
MFAAVNVPVNVGDAALTTSPVPVVATDISVSFASVNTA